MPATGTRGNARAAEQAALLTPEFPKPRARARPKTWAPRGCGRHRRPRAHPPPVVVEIQELGG